MRTITINISDHAAEMLWDELKQFRLQNMPPVMRFIVSEVQAQTYSKAEAETYANPPGQTTASNTRPESNNR